MIDLKLIIFVLFYGVITTASAQDNSKSIPLPIFSPFEGTVYEMPIIKHRIGNYEKVDIQEFFSDTVFSYPVIGNISLDKLNVPETYVRDGSFPGVDRKTKFAMILHSQMEVQLDACYEFTLSSDDGSRLWINEIPVVNNDGGHGMKTKKDTIALRKGNYESKLWYFQSFPDRFGLVMDTRIIGRIESCSEYHLNSKKPFRKIIFDNVYFETDEYTINQKGLSEISKIAKIIDETKCNTIRIVGHTDSQGTEQYNKSLSLNRSDAVASAIQELIGDQSINFIVLGRGQTEPIDTNVTFEGRKKNRRVEIFLID